MNPDTLLTLTEVAAAFIGFAAITTVLANRGAMHYEDRVRFLVILSLGGVTVIDCFIPFWVLEATGEGSTLWRYSFLAELAVGLPVLAWMVGPIRSIRLLDDSKKKVARSAFVLFALSIYGVIFSSLVWSLPFDSSQRVYEIGIVANLVIVALAFGLLVLDSPGKEVQDDTMNSP